MKQGKERFVAISAQTRELILMLRRDHDFSYREIEKRLDVSRETARLLCVKELPKDKEKARLRALNRKVKKKVKVVNRIKTRKRKPVPHYLSVRDYDFLQYIRVVTRWALRNNPKLSRGKLELLLYLYPIGAFTYSDFHKYHKTIGMYQNKTLADLIEDDYIVIWNSTRNKSTSKLYALSTKAKKLCDMMHKYSVGDEEIPLDATNKLVTDKTVRTDSYFADMIIDMNKRKKPPK